MKKKNNKRSIKKTITFPIKPKISYVVNPFFFITSTFLKYYKLLHKFSKEKV